MPPIKVFVFIGSLAFLIIVGFLLWDPEDSQEITCDPSEMHSHDGAPLHCD